MIRVKLSGGLGNQMFQYAFGLKMSIIAAKELELDLSFYEIKHDAHTTPRHYQLGKFALKDKIKIRQKSFFEKQFIAKLRQCLNSFFPTLFYAELDEKNFSYDETNLDYRGNCIYSGYWQSHKYFDDILVNLQKDFSLVNKLSEKNEEYLSRIKSTNSAALHIRRGDYVTNLMASEFHGLCTPDYYKNALEKVEKSISNPEFFVFTDDPEWVRENFKIKHKMHLIVGNDDNAEIDVFLFSQCKAHIIANSSFSWWGAYLAGSLSKCVIRPSRWFIKGDIDTSDLCPESWISI